MKGSFPFSHKGEKETGERYAPPLISRLCE
ncbi:hypothetical protein HNQ71_000118 [Mesorhizobium sangaii]|uniref:Uncharacterized protein n=1 Tax=Mesorhizobium sangaii TaxID=505389 RepID=A0A841NWP3_9HYPH|nr:hypothetical protein [Mesorhizobium sangaii]